MGQLLIIYFGFVVYLEEKKGIQWGIAWNSRKRMIQLGGRSCIIFSLSLVYLWNGKTNKSGKMKPIAESRQTKICILVSFKNSLKQGGVLLPLVFNFTLECTIRRV